MAAYYNEFDQNVVEWLRSLISSGSISPGDVDGRSIAEVKAEDLVGYGQHHFFAGIGGWSSALRLSGVPDGFGIWTASCPCQPFSGTGKGLGTADPRHLWPVLCGLVSECEPPVIVGEQVASSDGREWFAGVRADLEAMGYAVGCSDLCAAGVKSPNMRQRLFWGGYLPGRVNFLELPGDEFLPAWSRCECCDDFICNIHGMHAYDCDCPPIDEWDYDPYTQWIRDPVDEGLEGHSRDVAGSDESGRIQQEERRSTSTTDPWSDSVIGEFRGQKFRRLESGSLALAHGIPKGMGRGQPELQRLVRSAGKNREVRLKAYGNAIVPQVGSVFIRSFLSAIWEMENR